MADEDPPPYLDGAPRAVGSIPRFDPGDVSWNGRSGDDDFSALVAAQGYEPEPLLRMIVRAIIMRHPADDAPSVREREDRAMAALQGRAVRGRPEKYGRHYLMMDIVRAYGAERLKRVAEGVRPIDPELEPIIKHFIPDDHPLTKSDSVTVDAIRRWVSREFREHFDLWMKRVHDFDDPLRLQRRAAFRRVLVELEAAGVPVDMSVLDALPPL